MPGQTGFPGNIFLYDTRNDLLGLPPITLLTGRSVWRSGMRQVLIGGAAAALTYVVGRLIGSAVGA